MGDNGTTGSVIASPYPRGKDKGTLYQGGIHVPLLVAGAGVASPNRIATALVNTTDLFPTILQLADIDPADVIPAGTKTDGVSLLPYLGNRTHPSPRTWAYSEQFAARYNTRWERAIRDERYKLIRRESGSREFYDLNADSLESKNLLLRTLTSEQSKALNTLEQRLSALLATR